MPTIAMDWEKVGIVAVLGTLAVVFLKLYVSSMKDQIRFLRRMIDRLTDVSDKQADTLSQLAAHVNDAEEP